MTSSEKDDDVQCTLLKQLVKHVKIYYGGGGTLVGGGGIPGPPPCIYPSSFVIKQKNTHMMLFLFFIRVQPVLNDLKYTTIATTHENYS